MVDVLDGTSLVESIRLCHWGRTDRYFFSGVSQGSVWIGVKHPGGMGLMSESFPQLNTSQR